MRTVLTMTTSPQRMKHLPVVLDSLFNQIAQPDSVYLNLPARYRNCESYKIPDWLNDWEVTVLRPSYDFGPVMKILPVLAVETDMETLLITVDDDVRYPPDTISTLQNASQDNLSSAFGSRGFNFTDNCPHLEPIRGDYVSCHILQGYGACAYRRSHFDIERLGRDINSQPETFRFSDDVILSNHLASMGVNLFTVAISGRLEHMPWGDEDPQSLKYVDGGTHRRYEVVRQWLMKKGEWFAQN